MATNLLLLDESLLVQRVVELAFRDKDFEVHTAASADEAIAMAENLPPDIVVASVDMQRSDGLGFCRRLRQKPELSRTPLLVLTSARSDISEAETEEVAAAGSVEKPFKPETFTLAVERIAAAAGAPAPEPGDLADAPEKALDEEISDEASQASIVEDPPRPSDEDDARRKAQEFIGQAEDAASGVEEKEDPPPSAPAPGIDGEKLDSMIQKALAETLEKILPTLLRRIETVVVARLPDLVEQIVLREIEKIKRGE